MYSLFLSLEKRSVENKKKLFKYTMKRKYCF